MVSMGYLIGAYQKDRVGLGICMWKIYVRINYCVAKQMQVVLVCIWYLNDLNPLSSCFF